jgi:hypothetical protein
MSDDSVKIINDLTEKLRKANEIIQENPDKLELASLRERYERLRKEALKHKRVRQRYYDIMRDMLEMVDWEL